MGHGYNSLRANCVYRWSPKGTGSVFRDHNYKNILTVNELYFAPSRQADNLFKPISFHNSPIYGECKTKFSKKIGTAIRTAPTLTHNLHSSFLYCGLGETRREPYLELTLKLWAMIAIVLMSPFSLLGQNLY